MKVSETHQNGSSVILEGKQVTIGYRQKKHDVEVHTDLDFRLFQGELTCLLGANGSGKSTLLRTLSGVQPSLNGTITLMGKPLTAYSERERSRTIGVVLTERTQTGGLTVYELVALGRQPHTGFFGRLNATDKELIHHAIEAVGISHLTHSYMAELSDGERQKAFIAKALVQECPLILLDEPTAFLDVVSRIEIMTLLRRLAKEEQKAILLSTHDIDQALLMADRLWLLREGKGITCGVTEDLILNNQLETLFPESSICFNNQNGVFAPRPHYSHSIVAEIADERLRHWTVNALHRLGYECILSTEEQCAEKLCTAGQDTEGQDTGELCTAGQDTEGQDTGELCTAGQYTEGQRNEQQHKAQSETTISHQQSTALPCLRVNSAHELILQSGTETFIFTNFESLISHLER